MAEDNFDIEFDKRLEKLYNNNQQQRETFSNSPASEEEAQTESVNKQYGQLAEAEAVDPDSGENSGFINNLTSFAKFIPIGGVKGVEEIAQSFGAPDDLLNLPEPKNIGGSLGQGIGQFLPLFVGGGAVLRGGAKLFGLFQNSSKLSKAGQALINVGAGGLSDALSFDPKDPNLGNLALAIGAVSESPRASAMVKEYLAQQDEDDETKARLKNALTGGIAGAITDGLVRGVGYAFKGNKAKVVKAEAKDSVDEDGFLKDVDEEELEDVIDVPTTDKDFDPKELEAGSLETAEDLVEVLDAAKASGKGTDEAFKAFNEQAPSPEQAIAQTLSKSEANITKWLDTVETENPGVTDEIVKYFHDRINGKETTSQDFIIKEGRHKGKPLIESMNFLKFNTSDEALQGMQFLANKLNIKQITKTHTDTEDFNTVVIELLDIDPTDAVAVNNAISQVSKAAGNVEDAIKYVGTSKLLAGILDDQIALAAKADVAQGTKASRDFFLQKIETAGRVHEAGGFLSKGASDLLSSFKKEVSPESTGKQVRSKLTEKLNTTEPRIVGTNAHMIQVLKDQDTLVRKVAFDGLNTTRKVTITRAETTIGKRIASRVKSLKKTLSEAKSPSRGKFPKKAPVTSKEIESLLGSIKKVRLERDTLQNKFKREAPEQVKLQKQAANLSKEIEDLRAGKVKGPKGKELEPTEISLLKATKSAELKKLQDKIKIATATQKNIDKLNTKFNNLLIKRIRQDTDATPIPKAEKTSLEKELEKAIKREEQTLKDRVDTKELQRELVLKGSRQVQDEINKMDLRQLKTRFAALHKGAAAKTMDTLTEVYINGLLSSVKTIATVNPVGSGTALVSTIIERAFAGATGDQIAMREASMLAWNAITGLKEAAGIFMSTMRRGADDPSIKSDFTPKVHQRALSKEHFDLGGPLGAMVDFLGTVVNIPGKLLISTDQAFKGLVVRGETKALSYRKARNKFAGENLRDPAVKVKIAKEFDEILLNIHEHPDITEGAKNLSEKTSFTNDLPDTYVTDPTTGKEVPKPGLSRLVQNVLEKNGLFRIFVPFFKTPVNILNFTFERTPVLQFLNQNLKRELTSDDLAVKQLARAKVGTSFAVTGAMFGAAMTGNFTGAPPADRRLRANLQEQMGGDHWFSINLNGEWHKYDRFDPYGILMATTAGMATMAKSMINLNNKFETEGDPSGAIGRKYEEVVNSTALGIVGMMQDRHYVQGISEFVSLVSGDNRGIAPTLKRLSTFANPTIGFYSSFRRGVVQGTEVAKPRRLQRGEDSEDGRKKTGLAAIVDELAKAHQEAFASVTPGHGDIAPQKNLVGDVVAYPGTNGEFDLTHNLFTTMTKTSPGLIPSKSPLINKIAELESSIDQPSSIQKVGNIVLTENEKTFIIDKWTNLNKTVVEPLVKEKFFNNLPKGLQKSMLEDLISDMKQASINLALVEFPDRLGARFTDDLVRTALTPTSSGAQGFQIPLNLQGN